MNIFEAEIFYRSQDDLLLYARVYGDDNLPGRPALCLPGLTRNSLDFHSLALALASHPEHPRQVYCVDYRGRGRSDWDKTWTNYAPTIEMNDVLALMTLRGVANAAMIGTSRGGIIAMLMAVAQPSAIGAVVLNDIGPIIETAGLARIMGYAGKIPLPRDWDEAKRIVRDINRRQFTALDDAGWDAFAHRVFNEAGGRPAPGYDPNIGKSLSEIDIAKPVPTMWPHFEALAAIPALVLRGENSDLLSAATVREMQNRHPNLTAAVIPNEGHAPLLEDRFSQRIVANFLASTDAAYKTQ